ncbi:DNA-binding protein [Cereibacter sphaeroides]|uniref:helix-turn-helix transcriptional regulator n=1 Tax=Cereibacter sphaeroides TaxID=1063 RepID=UPI000F5469FB|nr:helix-turn-helix domain-containing protein [Cereibacter sphaeroides]AZB54755.1 DNA-binding protein [Cereibacter sphaeroides]AZB59021.1 DNA-binding protein [Cereibacter sphaeroides]
MSKANANIAFAPRLLPAPQAAAYLGVSATTLRNLPIPRKVLGGKRLYDRLELEAYADSLTTEGEERGNSCDGAFGIR